MIKNYLKCLTFAVEASYDNFQKKPLVICTFLPLRNYLNFCKFWVFYSIIKRIAKNSKKNFKGQKCITNGFKSHRLVTMKVRIFLRFSNQVSILFLSYLQNLRHVDRFRSKWRKIPSFLESQTQVGSDQIKTGSTDFLL